MTKIQNSKLDLSLHPSPASWEGQREGRLEFREFEFRYCFGFRNSNFGFQFLRSIIIVFVLLVGIIIGLVIRNLLPQKLASAKVITIKSRNLKFEVATRAATVGEMLAEQKLDLSIHPSPEAGEGKEGEEPSPQAMGRVGERLYSDAVENGLTINISRTITVTLMDGGSKSQIQTMAETVGDLLNLEKIGLAPTDQVAPPLDSYLGEGVKVIIDRIVDLEASEVNAIPYEIKLEYDPEGYYGKEMVVSVGIPGKKEQKFLITYKNGIEIKRKLLHEKILEIVEPEIRKFGTKIEIENIEEGRASWYAYHQCLCAAHPSYTFGRYVRVTSLTSGKSIIVKINDRGPEQAIYPERVIDLDSVAFRELAPLSNGTIAVKVELLK